MAYQFSTTVRDAWINAIETAIGTSPTLELRTGAPPANCAAADAGTVLATMVLPSDWLSAASGGAKGLLGTWQDLAADASGTFGHFRIKQGATTHWQGTCGGAGNDMVMDSTTVTAGQQVTVTAMALTAGGA
jgi:hypothetical protein